MRIMHVSNHREEYNGMVTAAIDLACAQADLGHDVAFCSGPGDFDDVLAEHRVTIFSLERYVSSKSAFVSSFGMLRAVRAFKPDVVHAHMVIAALVMWPLATLTRIPLVTCVQNSFSKFSIAMRLGKRVITGCNAVAEDMSRRGIPRRLLRPILNGTIGSARQSRLSRQTESAQSRQKSAFAITRPAVITACGLHPRKGVADLIVGFKAARQSMPELNLYIFGGGPHEEEYKTLAYSDGPSNITFCGQTPVLRPFFEAADVFVLASLADPAPLVICEAREAGLAIIATNVDGIPELLEQGEAGILIEPQSPMAIAEQLLLLFRDPACLAAWREKSQFRVDRLSVARVAAETIGVYGECIRR